MTYPPMEAKLVADLPRGPGWQYEPKWDGFRCLAFRRGASIDLRSKSGQPLERYFPEVVAQLRAVNASTFVLDGELAVAVGRSLSFDQLLQRIHPASSRVQLLSTRFPALFIVFDLLEDARGEPIVQLPLRERRQALEEFVREHVPEGSRLRLSPRTLSLDAARRWLRSRGVGLDGIIAKRLDLPYQSGNRHGMQKYKPERSADCVVGGFRYAAKGHEVGSLLLGLYDRSGLLHHVGFASNIKASERSELTRQLERLVRPPGFSGRAPGGPSRWSNERSAEWQPLAPKLVAEVRYDHFSGERFRHGTRFMRWRPDKAPKDCRIEQVEQESARLSTKLLSLAEQMVPREAEPRAGRSRS